VYELVDRRISTSTDDDGETGTAVSGKGGVRARIGACECARSSLPHAIFALEYFHAVPGR
jgi:hypothetical protein